MKFLRRWLLRLSTPVQRLMQKLHFPEKKMKFARAQAARNAIVLGDILLSREDWHFTNLFIPGFWSHAAIASRYRVIEAVGEGVQEVDIFDWLMTKDYVMVLRPTFYRPESAANDDEGVQAFQFALRQLGRKYDFEFSSGVKAWYCSELVYEALRVACRFSPFTLRTTWGVSTVTPQDFENAAYKGKFEIVFDSRID